MRTPLRTPLPKTARRPLTKVLPRLAALLALAAAVSAFAGYFQISTAAALYRAGDGASVTTDKTDYQPGETVIITGSGWAAGETVRLSIHQESSESSDTNLAAVADDNGNILNREFGAKKEHYGASFTLTATGLASGRTATATFTDGPVMSYAPPNTSLNYEASASLTQSDTVSVTVNGPAFPVSCAGCNGRYDAAASFVPDPGFPATIQVNPNPNSRTFRVSPPTQNSQSYNLVVKVIAGTAPGVYTGRFYATPDASDPDVINAPGGAMTRGAGTLLTINVNNSAAPNSTATAVTLPDLASYAHNTFTAKDVRVTLDASDLSGVANLNYSINGGNSTTVTTLPVVLTFTNEGSYIIQFFATDAFGLVESPAETFIVKIDRTAPSFSNCGPADTDWQNTNAQFDCTADDAGGSGLANQSDASFTLSTSVQDGEEDGNASTDSKQVCDAVGNCATAVVTGNKVDRKAPSYDCDDADGLWHADNVSVACTSADGGSGPATGSFTLLTDVADGEETAHASTGTYDLCDAVGNCAEAGPVTDNMIDRKKPTLSGSRAPAANAFGWNNSPVTATATYSDDGSGIDPAASVLADVTFSDGGTNLGTTFKAVDKVGNTATFTVDGINIDKVAPTLSLLSASPGPNANGWNNTDVTLTADAADDAGGSGVNAATLTGPKTITAEGAHQSASFTVEDKAGNSTTASLGDVSIDKTPPTINLTRPTLGTVYTLNQLVTAAYACSDSLSGIDTCSGTVANGGNLNTGSVGSHAFSVDAVDRAGNAAPTATGDYKVGYGIALLYDDAKSVKRGATIPIKVRLVDANGVNVSSPAVVVSAKRLVLLSGLAQDTAVTDQNNANSDGNFRYDASLGGYIFNLSTKNMGLSDGTWGLVFTAGSDPAEHTVKFGVIR
jgi:hypothetical protein